MTNRVVRSFIAGAVLAFACTRSPSATASAAAVPQEQNISPNASSVLVVNGASQPIPTAASGVTEVSGSVSVTNQPSTIAATQSGAWTVNVANPSGAALSVAVAGAPTVTVGSSQTAAVSSQFAGSPRTALVTVNANDARQPFFVELEAVQTPADGNFAIGEIVLNNGGRRLVIESISAEIAISSGATLALAFFAVRDANFTHHGAAWLSAVKIGQSPSFDAYVANQPVKMYADDGLTLRFFVETFTTAQLSGIIAVHGYLVDP